MSATTSSGFDVHLKEMSKLAIRFSIGVLLFTMCLASLFPFVWTSTASTPQAIPAGWKQFDLKDFSFYAPPDLKNQHVRGIDSAVWQFRNRHLTLSIDYGLYSNDLTDYINESEYRAEWLVIGGKKARLATMQMGDESRANRPDKNRGYVVAAYFPDLASDGSLKLTFWVNCVDADAREAAKNILLSIRFK